MSYETANNDTLHSYFRELSLIAEESVRDDKDFSGAMDRSHRVKEHIKFLSVALCYDLTIEHGTGLYRITAPDGFVFYYGAPSGKWRLKGHKEWHKSHNPRDFLENVIINPNEEAVALREKPLPKPGWKKKGFLNGEGYRRR